MPVHRVDFYYQRVISVYIEAEDENAIVEFLAENEDWHPLAADDVIVDSDVTEPDEEGDFAIYPEHRVTATMKLVGGVLVELDS